MNSERKLVPAKNKEIKSGMEKSRLPDSARAASELVRQRRHRSQWRKQAQAKHPGHVTAPDHRSHLPPVERRNSRKHRNPQPRSANKQRFSVEYRFVRDEIRHRQLLPAIALAVVGNDLEISNHSRPDAALLRRALQLGIIDLVRFDQCRSIGDVADAHVKMAIHALQRGGDHALFRCWHPKRVTGELHRHAARDEATSQNPVLPGLTEPAVVYLHRGPQSGNAIAALLRQTVTPGPGLDRSLKLLFQHTLRGLEFGFGVKIEIVAN